MKAATDTSGPERRASEPGRICRPAEVESESEVYQDVVERRAVQR